ncbi:hypothetical protein B0T21DRAFT_407577 [Apiosordaria backusii]|uniref:Uncharacterized protein n=1 Tax=Apiosordaria backusii TaxID=314023 RepID=A0AA40K3E5_9PEZI|nr:hypothetical protein B0T21DRAFT_407577 [Apiosordaria backusii]
MFKWIYKDDKNRRRKRHGYINPSIDILHLDLTWVPRKSRLKCRPPACKQHEPVLRVTLDPGIGPFSALRVLETIFPQWPRSIRTIDFWVPAGEYIETTSRYRICRAKTAKKITIARWENAVFAPQKVDDDCWGWEYYPQASRPLKSLPPDVWSPVNAEQEASWPIPDTEETLQLACVVSKSDGQNPRDILRKNGVLRFDAGFLDQAQSLTDPGAFTDTSSGDQDAWSIFKVVPPDLVLEEEITALSFAHIFLFSVLHHMGTPLVDLPPLFEGSPVFLTKLIQGLSDESLEDVFGAVDGVCSPHYMYSSEKGKYDEDKDWKYGTPEDLFGKDNTPLASGKGTVRSEKVFCAHSSHERVLKRRYWEKDDIRQEGPE